MRCVRCFSPVLATCGHTCRRSTQSSSRRRMTALQTTISTTP
uniref:Mitochondrial chaperone BCS1 n=1 Tax=Arundo donax TaxID=35708 RepID=A0A0A9GLF0_ARUDO